MAVSNCSVCRTGVWNSKGVIGSCVAIGTRQQQRSGTVDCPILQTPRARTPALQI